MIQHTLDWYKGEIFEGKFILGFGIFLLISAVIFYYFGNLPSAKALLTPLLVLGALFTVIGAGGVYSNNKKASRVEELYGLNQAEFVANEMKRVEGFQYLYPMSIAISLASFLISICLLYFVKHIHFQAIAIALILLGSAFAVIDYFSKERADIYYAHLKDKAKIEANVPR